MSKIHVRSAMLALVVWATGCVSYVPTDISELRPQDRVRMQLEQNELARLIAYANPSDRTVSGRFIEESPDSIALVVETPTSFQQVSVPRSSILDLDKRVPDNKKSFIVSAVIVGGVGVLAALGFEGRADSGIGDDTGVDESRIPLFGLRIPFSLGFGN